MKFIEKYGFGIVVAVAVIAFLIVFLIPLGVRVAKDMWQWALI